MRADDIALTEVRAVATAQAISALDWHALAHAMERGKIAPLNDAFRREATVLRDQAAALNANGGDSLFAAHVELYLTAVADEFGALKAGNPQEARRIDKTLVDPNFELVIDHANEQAAAAMSAAEETRRQIRWIGWLSTLVLVVVLSAISWRLFLIRDRWASRSYQAQADSRIRSIVAGSTMVVTVVEGEDRLILLSPSLGVLGEFALSPEASTFRDLLSADQYSLWAAADARVCEGGDDQLINLTMQRPDGTVAYFEAAGSRLAGSDNERVWLWRNISERKAADAQREAVADLGLRALGGRCPIEEFMHAAAEVAVELLGADSAAIAERVDPDSGQVVVRECVGVPQEAIGLSIPATRGSPSDPVSAVGNAVVIADYKNEPWFPAKEMLIAAGVRSSIAVVIAGPGRPWGEFGVGSVHPHRFTASAVDFVQAIGNVLSSAIERDCAEKELAHQAFHDSLTGVANHALLKDRATHALRRAMRTGSPVSALFCDIDDFKAINDAADHSAGDEVLRVVARRLEGCARDGDTVARHSGDEFVILMEDTDAEMASALAERILSVVSYQVPIGDQVLHPSVSIGIATSIPGMTADELIRNADIAMYEAKHSGKGRAALFQHSMRQASEDVLDLQADLRTALDAGQFSLHYQPIVGLADGQVKGVEALIRWNHPTRGNIEPARFIPVAEATGTIVAIGRWVLTEACRAATELQNGQPAPLAMHVNVSPQQLHDRTFVDLVEQTLRDSGLDPGLLVLEVTEGVLLDSDTAIERLEELHRLGVLIAIDDFGTGYTSIHYLRRLPIDILKIDRSFVSGSTLPEGERTSFLNAIIGLAASLDIVSLAEGIEDADQLHELVALGCDSAQGYLWARPVAESAIRSTIDAINANLGTRAVNVA